MVNSAYQVVRRIQRDKKVRHEVAYANGCAFANPVPAASDSERQAWARRWLAYYDTAARSEQSAAATEGSKAK